ncbi:VOC family protein [Lysobacter sp. LF1]|uniref:VOC family protein n=1 Tax=Lysobacter stagni TaxID=3045172 RepID=A0ABT6XIM8_9GAMM|nr:VOC family protein [Lysobacter sp. LF1]MDI9240015.1 VOC family protein [Lysobacter sp. LF1]
MQDRFQRITPFLWFNTQAEEAMQQYASIFPNSRILETFRYDAEAARVSGRPEGSVMTIEAELDGQRITGLNGGPHFTFNEAVSLVVNCHDQAEVDHFWDRLSDGGDPKAQVCGWLKDRFGVSWQIVPVEILALLKHPDPVKAGKAMAEMLRQKKPDIAAVRAAMQ